MYSTLTSTLTSGPAPASTRRRRRLLAVAALAALAPVSLAACGDDAATADGPATYVVDALDFSFDGVPDTVAAGSRLELTNSATELHELVAVRLPDDETRPVAELVHDDLESLFAAGPPAFVLVTPPGGEQIVPVGDGVLSEPGRYAIVCMIPTGVDPAAFLAAAAESGEGPPEIPDAGPPHIVHGMFAELIVTG